MTNAEARLNKSLRPRKPEGSLGRRTAQDVHLDSHTAPELCDSIWMILSDDASTAKRISPNVCRLCVYVIINKRSFESFIVFGADSDDICDPKWRSECPRNFRPTSSLDYDITELRR